MLEVLRRVIQEVNAARDLGTALDIIVERVQKAMGTQVWTMSARSTCSWRPVA